jgi:hypothetical protein
MKTYDNEGKLVEEIVEIVRPGFGVIRTTTTYGRDEQPLHQTISTQEYSGTVEDLRSPVWQADSLTEALTGYRGYRNLSDAPVLPVS